MITFLCLVIGLKYESQFLLVISTTIKVLVSVFRRPLTVFSVLVSVFRRPLTVFQFLLAFLGVLLQFYLKFLLLFSNMPKEKINRWAIRNKRMRAENHFNRVMCEYITYKYGEIANECAEFYDQLMEKYPSRSTKTYKGSKEFKKWVSGQIASYCDEQPEQSEQQSGEQPEQPEQQSNEQPEQPEQQSDEQPEQPEQQSDEQPEQPEQQSDEQPEQPEQHSNQELLLADNEVENIIAELENGGVPLVTDDDEGIHLDLYEEFVGGIENLDMEIELNDNIFW